MLQEARRASTLVPNWVRALGPVLLIAVMAALFLALDPIGRLRQVPPVEAIAVERTVFSPDLIQLTVRNDGPDPVRIAQVQVNDAYWGFAIDDSELDRLGTAALSIPYPWEEGLPVAITLVTSTGLTITHEIEAAALTPEVTGSTLAIYALLGLYIGVVPVALGLLWYPALRRAGQRALTFFLAFTLGLLGFLLIDTVAEGLELAGETATTLNGLSLFALGAVGAVFGLIVLDETLQRRRGGAADGLLVAYLVAAGIGLHNLGEGLAVGAALTAGQVALGTFLILGFALHNTTEGLAIIAPLSRGEAPPAWWHFAALTAVAGLPTVLGTWAGGFAHQPGLAAIAFGLAAGAIGQVLARVGTGMSRKLASPPAALGVLAGFVFMYATGLLTA